MKHRIKHKKLGRTSSHRNAMFRNQLAALLEKERIVTTLAKAKALRPVAEKMVTLGREDSVHKRRMAARSIADKALLKKLFEDISPRFSDRPGGYTRIIKLGPRKGDGAEMAILEFVDFVFGEDAPAAAASTSSKKEDEADESDEEEVAEESADEETEEEKDEK